MRSLTRTIFAAALAFAVTAPQAAASAIAQIKASEGSVEVLRNGRWRRAREGTELTIKDSIRTGSEGLAQIEFYDADGESGAQATKVDLVPNSEISIEHFEISKSLPRQRQGFVDVARGYLRAITKGWSVGSIFSVKAGSTVCGIRGSVADIGFNPDTGMATFTSLDGTMFTFPAPSLEMAVSMSINIGTNIAAGRPVMQGMAALANAALQRGDISQADRDAVLSVVSNTSNSDASSLSNNLSGVRMLTAGEAASIDRTGAAGGGGQVITLTQAQRTSLAVASVSKARTQAAKTLAAAGITDAAAETKAEALESRGDTDTVRGAGATGVDAILNSITQELVGSNELNAPASGN